MEHSWKDIVFLSFSSQNFTVYRFEIKIGDIFTDPVIQNSQLFILFFHSSFSPLSFRKSIKWWVIISATSVSVYASRGNIILLFLENKSYFLNQEIELAILKK